MKNKKTFIIIALLIAVLLIGIGYAAISSITLTISGTATATTSDNNFDVKFTGTPTTGGAGTTNAAIDTVTDTTGRTATIGVSGLTAKGQKATATYTILNASVDLSAELTATVKSNSNTEYFNVTYAFTNGTTETIAAGGTTQITVTVELIKTPIEEDQSSTITVELTAKPVQPTTGA